MLIPWISNCAPRSMKYAYPSLQQSSVGPPQVYLYALCVFIFMSLSTLPLTHRGDITILFLPWLPLMHHIHASPLDGGRPLQHCGQSTMNIKSNNSSHVQLNPFMHKLWELQSKVFFQSVFIAWKQCNWFSFTFYGVNNLCALDFLTKTIKKQNKTIADNYILRES